MKDPSSALHRSLSHLAEMALPKQAQPNAQFLKVPIFSNLVLLLLSIFCGSKLMADEHLLSGSNVSRHLAKNVHQDHNINLGTTISVACYEGEVRPVLVSRPDFQLIIWTGSYHYWVDDEFAGIMSYTWLGSQDFIEALRDSEHFSIAAYPDGIRSDGNGKDYPTFRSETFLANLQGIENESRFCD